MGKRRIDPENFSRALGPRVRRLRHERGWTLEHCEQLGFKNWRHLQAIESGKKHVNILTLVNLANLFGVHPADLLAGL